mgnify:CR=1 FL=1
MRQIPLLARLAPPLWWVSREKECAIPGMTFEAMQGPVDIDPSPATNPVFLDVLVETQRTYV